MESTDYLARLLIPRMKERRWGRIIHISGRDGFTGHPNRAHSVAAKAGLHGFTKALACEFSGYGITVNTVAPGAFNTSRPKEWYTWSTEDRVKQVPVGRLGEPWEIAKVCAFLASDDAAHVTGQAIHVNGGEAMF